MNQQNPLFPGPAPQSKVPQPTPQGQAPGFGTPHLNTPAGINPVIGPLLVAGQVPLSAPAATRNNGPVPKADYRYFSTYAQAEELLNLVNAALAANPITSTLIVTITDGQSEDGFTMNVQPDSPPSSPNVSCWHIEGSEIVGGISSITMDDVVGDLLVRCIIPDQSDFNNGVLGGPNLHVRVNTLGQTSLVECFWNA